jgi:hypothetical protein
MYKKIIANVMLITLLPITSASATSVSTQVTAMKKSLTLSSARYEGQADSYMARAKTDMVNEQVYLKLAKSYLALAAVANKLANSVTTKNLKTVRKASIKMHNDALDNFKYKQKYVK